MTTKVSKEDFVKETEKRIEVRKTLYEFYENVYLPMLCTKFDGKVYNKRLFTALNKEAKKIHNWLYVSENYGNTILIRMRLYEFNYNDTETLACKCITNADGRISFDATINDKTNAAWIKTYLSDTDEYQYAIDNYEECLKVANEMEEAVKKYNNLPSVFRNNMEKEYVSIY